MRYFWFVVLVWLACTFNVLWTVYGLGFIYLLLRPKGDQR